MMMMMMNLHQLHRNILLKSQQLYLKNSVSVFDVALIYIIKMQTIEQNQTKIVTIFVAYK